MRGPSDAEARGRFPLAAQLRDEVSCPGVDGAPPEGEAFQEFLGRPDSGQMFDEEECRSSVETGNRRIELVDLLHDIDEFGRRIHDEGVVTSIEVFDLAVLAPVEVVGVLNAEGSVEDEAAALRRVG